MACAAVSWAIGKVVCMPGVSKKTSILKPKRVVRNDGNPRVEACQCGSAFQCAMLGFGSAYLFFQNCDEACNSVPLALQAPISRSQPMDAYKACAGKFCTSVFKDKRTVPSWRTWSAAAVNTVWRIVIELMVSSEVLEFKRVIGHLAHMKRAGPPYCQQSSRSGLIVSSNALFELQRVHFHV